MTDYIRPVTKSSEKVLHRESVEAKRLPGGFSKPDDGDWVCMSAEVPPEDESDNDVIRVAGLSTKRHTSQSPIKLLGQHLRGIGDGTPAVIGRMEEFKTGKKTWKGESVPAMYGRFSWAKDGDGKITELAGKYKSLWEGGYLDSVSIGFRPVKSKALNAEKPWDGYEYIETELVELSIVTIPANPAATVLRAIADTFDKSDKPQTKTKDVPADTDAASRLNDLTDRFETLLDDMECAIKVASPKAAEPAGDHTHPQAKSIDFKQVAAALDALKTLLPK